MRRLEQNITSEVNNFFAVTVQSKSLFLSPNYKITKLASCHRFSKVGRRYSSSKPTQCFWTNNKLQFTHSQMAIEFLSSKFKFLIFDKILTHTNEFNPYPSKLGYATHHQFIITSSQPSPHRI